MKHTIERLGNDGMKKVRRLTVNGETRQAHENKSESDP